jgi:hypothetical protein
MLHILVLIVTILAYFICSVAVCSIFEWLLHRHVMHKPLLGFMYPYIRHAKVHHRIFRADESYHLKKTEDKHTIPMAWWNGPVLILIASLPSIGIGYVLHKYVIVAVFVSVCTAYFIAYESIHWCMHLPHDRFIERTGIFFRLNGHHLLHHRYMNKNFNVVLPFADWLFGTLIVRSKVSFAQARGPAVPDVQPLSKSNELTAGVTAP